MSLCILNKEHIINTETIEYWVTEYINSIGFWRSKVISRKAYIACISKQHYNLSKDLGVSAGAVTNLHKHIFPNRTSNSKPHNYILSLSRQKFCYKCEKVKSLDLFKGNAGTNTKDKKQALCIDCSSHKYQYNKAYYKDKAAKRRVTVNKHKVAWGQKGIIEFYKNCPEGYEVDHIIPINGKTVCGLHVLGNLQYLPACENRKKSNKYPYEGAPTLECWASLQN